MILAIESSCDDTCAAVVTADGLILSNVVASQGIHDEYGGVVPEIAARQHLEAIDLTVKDALSKAHKSLDQISAIAVTQGPGLIGSLVVGLQYAKALALASGIPLIPVDHLDGHIFAPTLQPTALEAPYLALIASGGHTFIEQVVADYSSATLGRTIDDAAGEAIDKGSRLLGLPYPGGPELEKLARTGDHKAFDFPIAEKVTGINFSFSGLKTALLYKQRELGEGQAAERRADLAASYQDAVVRSLLLRVKRAVKQTGISRVTIGGGVAANGYLRERLAQLPLEQVVVPEFALCTDNAAMVAAAARFRKPVDGELLAGLLPYAAGSRRK